MWRGVAWCVVLCCCVLCCGVIDNKTYENDMQVRVGCGTSVESAVTVVVVRILSPEHTRCVCDANKSEWFARNQTKGGDIFQFPEIHMQSFVSCRMSTMAETLVQTLGKFTLKADATGSPPRNPSAGLGSHHTTLMLCHRVESKLMIGHYTVTQGFP